MKIKVLLVLFIVVVSIFLIYLFHRDNKIYYVSINDYSNATNAYDSLISSNLKKANKLEKFINEFSSESLRITDVINSIDNNTEIIKNNKKISIQHALIKADLLTIMLGNNELKYKISTSGIKELYSYVDSIINDYDILLESIRKYCKEDIIVIGVYYETNNEDILNLVKYYNKKLSDLSKSYDIKFIDSSKSDISNLVLKNLNK